MSINKVTKQDLNENRQKCLPHPQTRRTHCPQCGERYNTEKVMQVGHTVREALPQTWRADTVLKITTKTQEIKSNDKEKMMRVASHKR